MSQLLVDNATKQYPTRAEPLAVLLKYEHFLAMQKMIGHDD